MALKEKDPSGAHKFTARVRKKSSSRKCLSAKENGPAVAGGPIGHAAKGDVAISAGSEAVEQRELDVVPVAVARFAVAEAGHRLPLEAGGPLVHELVVRADAAETGLRLPEI